MATNTCILPGSSDGGIEWFGESEPPIRLVLCDSCTSEFISKNGGPDKVIIEAIVIALQPENPFSSPRREIAN